MSDLQFDRDGFVDMDPFTATDPDAALDPQVLASVQRALAEGDLGAQDEVRWDELVRNAVDAGPGGIADAHRLDAEQLLPPAEGSAPGDPPASAGGDGAAGAQEHHSFADDASWHGGEALGLPEGHGDDEHPQPGHHEPG